MLTVITAVNLALSIILICRAPHMQRHIWKNKAKFTWFTFIHNFASDNDSRLICSTKYVQELILIIKRYQ